MRLAVFLIRCNSVITLYVEFSGTGNVRNVAVGGLVYAENKSILTVAKVYLFLKKYLVKGTF